MLSTSIDKSTIAWPGVDSGAKMLRSCVVFMIQADCRAMVEQLAGQDAVAAGRRESEVLRHERGSQVC
jgi:hypothetical protein